MHPMLYFNVQGIILTSILILLVVATIVFRDQRSISLVRAALLGAAALAGIAAASLGYLAGAFGMLDILLQYLLATAVVLYSGYHLVVAFSNGRTSTGFAFASIIGLLVSARLSVSLIIGIGLSHLITSLAWWVTTALVVATLIAVFRPRERTVRY